MVSDWCDDERDMTHLAVPDGHARCAARAGAPGQDPAPYVDMGAVCRSILRELSPRRHALPPSQHHVRHIDHEYEPQGAAYWHDGMPRDLARALEADGGAACGAAMPQGHAPSPSPPPRAMEKRRHRQAAAAAEAAGGLLLDANVPSKLRRHAYF